MKNQALKQRLQAKIKEIRQAHSTNNNSIFSAQQQINALFDIVELIIADEDVQLAQRPAVQGQRPGLMPAHGHGMMGPGGVGVFAADRPPTVEEVASMEIPPTNETQVFMTHQGTKVIPPAYTGIRPFLLPPGAEIPKFPSLAEAQAAYAVQQQEHAGAHGYGNVVHPPGYRLGEAAGNQHTAPGFAGAGMPVGSPSNVTVPGVSPAGAPPGISGSTMPAVPGTIAAPMPGVPVQPVTSAPSVPMAGPSPGSLLPGGIPASLGHMLGNGVITEPEGGGARNITGQPVNAFPGGAVITE
jgi:hypothetical protein